MSKKKKGLIIGILLIAIVLVIGIKVIYKYPSVFSSGCNFYELVVKGKCVCPEGYNDFGGFGGPYCASDSQKPCNYHIDCPENERCISKDGKSWFCSGRKTGCYRWDPERPEDILCAD